MKTRVKLPTLVDAKQVITSKTEVVVEHRFFKGALAVTAMQLTVEGDGGSRREYVLIANGSTGSLTLRELEATVEVTFDTLLPEEFTRRQETRRITARRGHAAALLSPAGQPSLDSEDGATLSEPPAPAGTGEAADDALDESDEPVETRDGNGGSQVDENLYRKSVLAQTPGG